MHSLLENYLVQVTDQLAPLPSARRNDELRELREHLLNAVAAYREKGQTEEEAAFNAMRNFGTPEILGGEVVSVWRRGERRESLRSFVGAAICMTVLSSLGITLFSKVVNMSSLRQSEAFIHYSWLISMGLFLSAVLVMALAGGVCGLVFPKRAVKGTACAMVVIYAISIGPGLVRTALAAGSLRGLLLALFVFVGQVVIFGGPAIVSAWLISRWRGNYSARLVRT